MNDTILARKSMILSNADGENKGMAHRNGAYLYLTI